jgi:hypothetical protein
VGGGGGRNYGRGGGKKLEKTEKKKRKIPIFYLIIFQLIISTLAIFIFYHYNYSLLTVYFSKKFNFKDSPIFIILHFLQLVTWFPKTALGGGA